ncbi:MAG: CidA/LrgA family protein [Oscillospiraceae bacterium]
MRVLLQIGIIMTICVIGDFISNIIPVAFPSSVISMIILFFCFLFRIFKIENFRESSDFLLKNMAFFFIPAGAGIITVFEILKSSAWQILVVCVVSTILTFASTAYTVKFVVWLQEKLAKRGKGHA